MAEDCRFRGTCFVVVNIGAWNSPFLRAAAQIADLTEDVFMTAKAKGAEAHVTPSTGGAASSC